MVFYGNGVVWDSEFQKELCKFERRWDEDGKRLIGKLETDNHNIIFKLKAAGYDHEGVDPTAAKPVGNKIEKPAKDFKNYNKGKPHERSKAD